MAGAARDILPCLFIELTWTGPRGFIFEGVIGGGMVFYIMCLSPPFFMTFLLFSLWEISMGGVVGLVCLCLLSPAVYSIIYLHGIA